VGRIVSRAHALRAAAVLALLVPAGAPAIAQISPGPLSRPHAALEGSSQCASCHDPGRGVAPSKCLACHKTLGARVSAGKGLHARPEYRDCKTCHVEHQGVEYDLVWWGKAGRAAFDHAQTGHTLEGAHARVDCRQCHQPAHNPSNDSLAAARVNVERTYLGLGTACASCHADVHQGQFKGRDCTACHTQTAWKPAPGFDHAKTSWPLTGRHTTVACARCHRSAPPPPGSGVRVVSFRNVSGRDCVSCHTDVHRGRLGTSCATCHSTSGWQRVQRADFDHSRTGYPLEGRHVSVACDKCHRARETKQLAHQHCTDCHQDAHFGQLASRPDRGACESCHDVAGFTPARFGIEEHQKTTYPLAGAHLAVACNSCHTTVSADELRRTPGVTVTRGASGRSPRLRFASTRCAACHRDVHQGDLDRWVKAGGCESCHNGESWRRATFDHAKTRFALVAGHARARCGECHKKVEVGTPRERVGFAGTPLACEKCHGDPHRGQFQAGGKAAVACERCHAATTLRASLFDHSRDSGWPLDGAHARIACATCHRRETRDGVTFVRYKPLPKTCSGCHGPSVPRGKDAVSR
jgi:hypothetical protein